MKKKRWLLAWDETERRFKYFRYRWCALLFSDMNTGDQLFSKSEKKGKEILYSRSMEVATLYDTAKINVTLPQ